MVTLTDRVSDYLKNNELYTLDDVLKQFPDEAYDGLKTSYYRYKRFKNSETNKTVRIEDIEPLIAKELTKGYDQAVIRLALDLIKLKQVDKGIDDDIDISKYIMRAQEVLGDIDIE